MSTSFRRRLAVTAAAAVATLGPAVATPAPAHAAPVTDYNGARISWPSINQCTDSTTRGTHVHAQPTYRTPSTGYYGVQMFLLTASGRTLAYTPFTAYDRRRTPTNIRFQYWYNGYWRYYGEAFVVAYVFKWNGSAYTLVAQEYLPCL